MAADKSAITISLFVLVCVLTVLAVSASSQPAEPAEQHTLPAIATDSSATVNASASSRITLTVNGFQPNIFTVSVGSEVTWYNGTALTHILQSGVPYVVYLPLVLRQAGTVSGLTWESAETMSQPITSSDIAFRGTLAPGGMFTYTFASPGMVPYYLATAPNLTGRIEVLTVTLRLVADPVSQTVGASSLLTATVTDSFVQPVPDGTVVSFTTSLGHVESPRVTANGVATSSISSTLVGVAYITATTSGPALASTVVTFTSGLPPDPGTVAPPLDGTVATTLISATEFLYTGPNPIQIGVAPGTISPIRVAVLRGRVLNRDNQPLPGVQITILNHAEFGQTLSRADGMFDMVVNGGGLLVINYAKDGYLPVQRPLDTPWQDYMWAPDVVLIPRDSQVTAITLTAPITMQVAQGSVISDSDGIRQATLLFPQGVVATAVLPGGISQTLTTLHVRATEYTVGPDGPKTMPAPLPPASSYTYAADFSIDEADAAGAKDIVFSRPIINYVDNFLSFPAGITVPVGYYDRSKAAWVPSESGVVLKIVAISGGLAELDVTGDDVADSPTVLAAWGITDTERSRLAALYPVGKSLWRYRVLHFSAWDANWGTRCKGDKCDAPQESPPGPPPPHECDSSGNSIIGCQDQTLGETVDVVGTPFGFHYRSDRTPGYKEAYTLRIPLSYGPILPETLRIDLEIEVAGRVFRQGFAAQPKLSTTFTWDGKDVYGRVVQGPQPVTVRIGYVYEMEYVRTARFGYNGNGIPITGDFARSEMALSQVWKGSLGAWAAQAQGLGGWTLDVHHAYDPQERALYQGDGTRRSAVNLVANIVAGTSFVPSIQECDNIPAAEAFLNALSDVEVAPDGSYYVSLATEICRVGTDGIIRTVVAAPEVNQYPRGLAVAPDGSLYFGDPYSARVRQLGADGVITTVAGTGNYVFSGDGGPATLAGLDASDIALGPDGSLYIADQSNHRVRRVGTDGIIATIAGNGTAGFSGDGGPATQAKLFGPQYVAVAPDGSVYISDYRNGRIRRVGTDGVITTTAGIGAWGFSGDGGPASQAAIGNVTGLDVAPDGTLYIADEYYFGSRIRRISPDGMIGTVAGTGLPGFNGNGRPATQTNLRPKGVDVAPDNTLLVADCVQYCRVRRVASPLPGFTVSDIAIPSEDGSELYQFDFYGRHLRTLNALTGATLYQFGYDSAGRLITVTDGNGNVTTVERDAAGDPTALVAPFSQRTTLGLDASGYLSRITNPAGETRQFSYTNDGLLTSITDPRLSVFTYMYDVQGRLIKAQDPVGGYKELARGELANGFIVSLTTALDRTTTYAVERLATGGQRLVNTFPDGTGNWGIVGTDGSQTITTTEETLVYRLEGPDPRFGMMAPLATSQVISTPGGLRTFMGMTSTVYLTNSADILSLSALTDTTTFDERTITTTFTAGNRLFTDTTSAGRQTYTSMDAQGRLAQEQAAGLGPVSYIYDSRGRLVTVTEGSGVGARLMTLSYDLAGYLSARTNPLNYTSHFSYDAAGRLVYWTMPDDRVITYTYDANGNVLSIAPPDRPPHVFTYTPVNLLGAYVPPAVGAGSAPTQYQYDADRGLTRIINPDGQTTSYEYNGAGQLVTLTTPSRQVAYGYDQATGNLTTVAASDGVTLAYGYDGDMNTRTAWGGVVTGIVDRSFGAHRQVVSLTVSGDNNVTFGYDVDSLLTRAGDLTLNRDPLNGLLVGTALGHVTDTWSYNGFGEPVSYTAAYSGASLLAVQYNRDPLGRISQQIETIGGVTDVYSYTYDLTGRLSAVRKNGASIGVYTYDGNSNRLSFTGPGGAVYGSYDNQDRLLQYGGTVYTYTANGELLSKTTGGQTTVYQYDMMANLLAVTLPDGARIDYVVDGSDRRVGKKINGMLVQGLLYEDELKPIAELDSAGAITSVFIYGTQHNVPDYMLKGGKTYRIIADHLGSPRLVVDVATGQVAQRMDYDEFGNVVLDTQPGFQPFGFAGGLYDPHTGLTRFGARDYDAVTGRWTAKDPIGFLGSDVNLYRYAYGDPVNTTDPDGLGRKKPSVPGKPGTGKPGGGSSGKRKPGGPGKPGNPGDDLKVVPICIPDLFWYNPRDICTVEKFEKCADECKQICTGQICLSVCRDWADEQCKEESDFGLRWACPPVP